MTKRELVNIPTAKVGGLQKTIGKKQPVSGCVKQEGGSGSSHG